MIHHTKHIIVKQVKIGHLAAITFYDTSQSRNMVAGLITKTAVLEVSSTDLGSIQKRKCCQDKMHYLRYYFLFKNNEYLIDI